MLANPPEKPVLIAVNSGWPTNHAISGASYATHQNCGLLFTAYVPKTSFVSFGPKKAFLVRNDKLNVFVAALIKSHPINFMMIL
jgi:hypothetical protein